jgi:hypothetical protein
MGGDPDVIIDADAACPPFGKDIGLDRQRLQRRTIDLFEQLPVRHAEPADWSASLRCLIRLAIAAAPISDRARNLNRSVTRRSR